MTTRLRGRFRIAVAALAVLATSAGGGSASPGAVPSTARSLGYAPATVRGMADAGNPEQGAPVPSCAAVAGVQWYTVRAPHRGPLVARLRAHGNLDAVVAVYRVVRNKRTPVLCARTDGHGRARVAWYGYLDGSYLVGVGRLVDSEADAYTLKVLAAEQRQLPPGDPLPATIVTETVNPVLDTSDAWATRM